MVLKAKFKIRGKEYSVRLDTDKPDRNNKDENFTEWFITATDGRVLEITVWKNTDGSMTHDGTVEAYKNRGDFYDGRLLDRKSIKLK